MNNDILNTSSKIIDGKKIAGEIKDEIRRKVLAYSNESKAPTLAVIIVGEDPASMVYVRNKKEACKYTGIHSIAYELPESTSETELIALITELNNKPEINGILVQLPLPRHISEINVLHSIDYKKDVDCFHPHNVGCLSIGSASLLPCTPAGIIELIKRGANNSINSLSDASGNLRGGFGIEGRNCVVIGRSNIVGKPTAMLMLAENATVTICHSKTVNLPDITSRADILIAAVGKPKFVTADMVGDGATVIDVGVHRQGKKLCGDVDFDAVAPKAGLITPVPGGVGPMTIAMLMKNCLTAFIIQNDIGSKS